MSGKITWLLIILFLFNVKIILSQNEDDEDSDSFFNVNSATIDDIFSNVEEKDDFINDTNQTSHSHSHSNEFSFSCEKLNLTTTFVRYSNLLSKRKTIFDGNIDLLTCINYCKKDKIPVTGEGNVCAGLNYFKSDVGVNTCQLIDKFQIGDLEKSIEDDNLNHWYQKICLNIKNDCKNKLISFDGFPNHKIINGNVIREIKSSIENCFEICNSMENCYGVNILKDDNCQLIELSNTNEKEGIIRDANVNFFRNECTKKKCLLKNNTFLFYQNTRITSTRMVTSSTSLEGCLNECITGEVINCKGIQFSRNKNECNIYDFSIFKTNPSQYIDIYKPVCLNIPLNRNCNKRFLYEVVEKTSVGEDAINLLYYKIDANIDNCLQECLNDDKCYMISFHKSLNKCSFYNSFIKSTNYKKAEDFDLYIVGCDYNSNVITNLEGVLESTSMVMNELFPTPTVTLDKFELSSINENDNSDNLKRNDDATTKNCFLNLLLKLVLKGRTLRQEYRIFHQKNVMNVTHCGSICKDSIFNCTIFAFSVEEKNCYLSKNSSITIQMMTQENDKYDVWSFLNDSDCLNDNIDDNAFGHIYDRTPKIYNKNNEVDFLIADNEKNKVTTIDFVKPQTTTLFPFYSNLTTMKATIVSTITTKFNYNNKIKTTSTAKANDLSSDNRKVFLINKSTTKLPIKIFNHPNTNSTIPQVMKEDKIFSKLLSTNLKVHVTCYPTGANVTFNVISKNYTGVVYAAERFTFCKTVVHSSNTFSLFVPRPHFNNSCNGIEINRQLTAILVLSNDLVIPYDITTKDDFFYEIKCDYSDRDLEESVYDGFVLGEPESIMVMDDKKKNNERSINISLKIMRGDKPVEHVFIGEQLKAVLISDYKTTNMSVISCNASRVGGIDDKLKSISLISNGCSLMPQIISDIGVGKYGLEANITAFRIDGSSRIDILCDVSICHNNCKKRLPCNDILNNIENKRKSVGNEKRKRFSDFNDTKYIEKRIHVLVDEEFSSLFSYQLTKQYEDSSIPKTNTSSIFSNIFNDNPCIDIHIFGVSVTIFLLIIIILISIISCSRKVERKKYGVVAYTAS
uniref:Apple domain-containing protein n=1 Tax=Strongyloides venezuelensis TaxID=75913 RepID=A0A0K0FCQ4_STRVS